MTKRKTSKTESSKHQGQQEAQAEKFHIMKVTHVRRCHHCDHVSTSSGSAIMTCQNCGKHLAPYYFFDESSLDGLEAEGLYRSLEIEPKKIQPIWGISFYWAEEVQEQEATKDELKIKDLHESHLRRHKGRTKKYSGRHSGHRD